MVNARGATSHCCNSIEMLTLELTGSFTEASFANGASRPFGLRSQLVVLRVGWLQGKA